VLDNLREGVPRPRTSTTPTLNPLYRDNARPLRCGPPTLPDPGSRIEKAKVESAVGHAKKNSSERTTLRESGTGARPILDRWEAKLGGYAHPRHHQTASGSHVLRKKNPMLLTAACGNRSANYQLRRTGGLHLDGCVEVEACVLRSCRQAGLGRWGSESNGMSSTFVSSIPRADYSCENTYVRNGAGTRISARGPLPTKLRSVWCGCSAAPGRSGHPCRYPLQPYL